MKEYMALLMYVYFCFLFFFLAYLTCFKSNALRAVITAYPILLWSGTEKMALSAGPKILTKAKGEITCTQILFKYAIFMWAQLVLSPARYVCHGREKQRKKCSPSSLLLTLLCDSVSYAFLAFLFTSILLSFASEVAREAAQRYKQ